MTLDPCCDASAGAMTNCQGCGWMDVVGPRRSTPGYTISTGIAWSPGGQAFRQATPRFVIRLCARCAVRLALQILDQEVG